MSIKQLESVEPFAPKKKEFTVKVGDQDVTFTARQMSYLEVLDLAVETRGEDSQNRYAYQIAKSITDPEGNRMTYEQAMSLPDDLAKVFWDATLEVNKRETAPKE